MVAENSSVTHDLARLTVSLRWEDIPEAVRHEATRAFVNWVGCAVGGSDESTVITAIGALKPLFGAPQAQVLGTLVRCDVSHAALLNGISSHVRDFDDTHPTALHPSAPVFPALVALAEWKGISGAQLLHAFIIAVEAQTRLATSVLPEHYERGWHMTSTAGVFGAAIGSGVLLNLDEQRMRWAIGLAATQSSGLRDMFGSMTKSFHPGRAAQSGLVAALLAGEGFTSSDRSIEAIRGFGHVLSGTFDSSAVVDGFGSRFELLRNMYKPYACGLVMHAAIDAALQLREVRQLTVDQIERVDAEVSPSVLELTGKHEPTTGLEGKFSIFHAISVALIDGAAGESQFSDDAVARPAVVGLRKRIYARANPKVPKAAAELTISLHDGTRFSQKISAARGTVDRPLTEAELERKFRDQCSGRMPEKQVEPLLHACWELGRTPDISRVVRLATASD